MTKVAPVDAPPTSDRRSAPTSRRTAAILSPAIDALCTGGLSLLLFSAMITAALVWNFSFSSPQLQGYLLLATALVNWPHFMASYRLLYGSPETRRRYPWASVILPALLVAYCLAAMVVPRMTTSPSQAEPSSQQASVATNATAPAAAVAATSMPAAAEHAPQLVDPTMLRALFVVNLFYLAWHYTGQGWGMCASFAYLQGLRFEPRERHLVRIGFRALLVVHVVAVLAGLDELSPEIRAQVTAVQPWTLLAAALTIPLGIAGFVIAWRRTRCPPGMRTVVPWGSMYVWYAMLPIVPNSFVWLQLAHALQYLEFPLRVELNRRERRQKSRPSRWLPRAGYVGLYYGALLAAGLLTFASPYLLGGNDGVALAVLVAAAVNVHHYFVDGCIWKISNPAVRGELFAHVAR
ncbi:MAG: hypothetical protein AB7U73_25280 [Pirellulales bacterium]